MNRERLNRIANISITSFVILITLCATAWAKILYVSPNGNDAVSYASNDVSHPWLTPSHAWDLACAGDTVYFRGGTYYITSQINTRLLGSADGTASMPIIFKNYPGETVIFNGSGGSFGSWPGAMILVEQNYNIIDGITFTNCKGAVQFSYDNGVIGGALRNCTITNLTANNDGENYAGVVVYGASNITIQNCKITGTGAISNGNTACITIFNAPGVKVLNCELSGTPSGIYYKHGHRITTDTGIEIAYNYIHNTTRSNYGIFLNCHYANVHNNIIGTGGGLAVRESNGGAGGTHNIINHNTVLAGNFVLGWDDFAANSNTVINNIFVNRPQIGNNGDAGTESTMYTSSNYNIFPGSSVVRYDGALRTLSAWRTLINGDGNSISGTPTFLGSSSPSTIAGFALSSTSIGKGRASDGKDIGADVSAVGAQSSSQPQQDTISPVSPTGVSIQLVP